MSFMEKGKMRKRIQTGLRIHEKRYDELAIMASDMGISINSLALMLIDIGLSVIRLGTVEVLHDYSRSHQDNDE